MHIIYWAHSYRPADGIINEHFGVLMEESERIVINFDPPSKAVNSAKLEQNLRACDGMVACLPWRPDGISQYILYEICLALRAQKPVLAFIDDRIPDGVLPHRVLQQRYSHLTFFRQVREQVQALRLLKTYMGEPPPPQYQPYSSRRSCGLIGFSRRSAGRKAAVSTLIRNRGYRVVELEGIDIANPLEHGEHEAIACLDVAIRDVDSRARRSSYWTGIARAATIPMVEVTADEDYEFNDQFPRDFQPRIGSLAGGEPLDEVVAGELDLFEQNFLEAQDAATIHRYTRMQLDSSAPDRRHDARTRSQYVEYILGDKYNVSGQAGAVGRGAHAHGISLEQLWSQASCDIDLAQLATELRGLRKRLSQEASNAEQQVALGNVDAAAKAAEDGAGPKALGYLQSAGKWVFGVATEVGTGVAVAAAKKHLGL